jgi:DNA mismatch repair protein MutS
MFFTRNLSRAMSAILAITVSVTSVVMRADATVVPVYNNMYGEIADLYLKSLFVASTEKQTFIQDDKPEKEDDKAKVFTASGVDSLSEFEQARVVFELFSQFGIGSYSKVLNRNVFKDLALFSGDGDNSATSFMSRVGKTNTIFGKAALAHMLAAPTDNVHTLLGRQAFVQYLLTDTQTFNELDVALQDVAGVQESVLSFWKPTTDFIKKALDKVYWNSKTPFKRLNKTVVGCESGVKAGQLSTTMTVGSLPIAYFAIPMYAVVSIKITAAINKLFGKAVDESMASITIGDTLKDLITGQYFQTAYSFAKNKLSDKTLKQKLMIAGGAVPAGALVGAYAYMMFYRPAKMAVVAERERTNIRNYLQGRLIDFETFVRSARNISDILERTPELSQVVEADALSMVTERAEKVSSEFAKLVQTLSTRTFKGKASVLSLHGRVLHAHKLMESVKNDFVQVMEAVGRVDAYLSIAKLYQEHEGLPASYCFVDYVDSSRPVIDLQGAWNPFINPEVVVANNITLGNGKAQNMIITGPNAGGKSTSLKSVMINVLLAQTFGIAPAVSAKITPFAKLATHLNITDDISSGDSLFMAEAKRAKELVDMVNGIGSNQFAFTLMDEIFSGTDPKVGARAGYKFAAQLGQNTNSINMIATHFPRITKLEKHKSKLFSNHKVMVEKNSDGSIHYFYKLVPGISDQNIAMDILVNQGVFN